MTDEKTPRPEGPPSEQQVYAQTRQPAPPPKEFLESPALSEILENMPSHLARGLIYVLLFIVVAGILYAYFGKMDDVVSAQGSLIPEGDAVIVQALKSGPLAAIYVKEGDQVRAQQALAQLDLMTSSIEGAKQRQEYERHRAERECVKLSMSVLREALSGKHVRIDEAQILKTCTGEEADVLLGLRKAEMEYENALLTAEKLVPPNLKAMAATVKSKEDALAFKKVQLKDTEVDLARAKGQWETYQEMYKRGLASKIKLLEEQKKYEEARTRVHEAGVNIATAEVELQETRTKLEVSTTQQEVAARQARETYEHALLKYRATVNALELKRRQADMALANLALDSKLGDYSRRFDVMRAPVSGTVASVRLRHIGELVKAGDPLFTLHPAGRPLVAKALVWNRDIGRVKVGLPAKLKLDAFPYQNYGILPGRVVAISPEARHLKEGSAYEATIALDRSFLTKGGKKHDLFTGLSLTAQIVVEKKRIIEVFLEPFKKLKEG